MSDKIDENDKQAEGKADKELIEHMRPGEEGDSPNWKEGDPLPNVDKAEFDKAKFEQYSLNPDHPDNNGKWQGFEQLGYDVHSEAGRRAGAEDVSRQLREELPTSPATRDRETSYGQRYEVRSDITGPNGGDGTLVSVWQVDNGCDNPRMITNWAEVHR